MSEVPLSEEEVEQRRSLVAARDQASRYWQGAQRFFDLFVFHHNLHTLRAGKRAGNSLLAAARVEVVKLFGTDDLYTILGFPPASRAFTPVKSVQSQAA